MNRSPRWFMLILTLLALTAMTGAVLADEPIEGRAGRAEVRFLEGMIDHHQMALDMAMHCLERASTDEVRAVCEAVIVAQAPEIAQMQGWLADWYGISYAPMSMLGTSQTFTVVPAPAAPVTGMCGMMGGEGCGTMDSMGMSGMGGMMDGMSDMAMPMMQMQMMGMQMQMMQMMMMHMGMGGMNGMSGMSGMGGMSGMSGMSEMGGMSDMNGMSGMSGMSGMNGMSQMPAAQATPTPDHSAHHPAAEATTEVTDHSQHSTTAATSGVVSDPAMTMGMMAGFDRLTGLDYDLAWLEAMIEHHDGAIRMSERLLPWTGHAELTALAEAIMTAQSAEIEQMEVLITELSE